MNAPLRESDAARAGRGVQSGWGSTDVERALAATHARLRVRRQRIVLGGVGFAVAMAAATLLIFFTAVDEPTLLEYVPVPNPVESVTHFADGSEARSSAGSKVVVRTSTETSIETALDAGEAEFSVVPNPERRFVVHAGGVTVEVVGTRFRVEHRDARVLVAVSRGKVRVTAGAEHALLVEGESRWFARGSEASPPETATDDVSGGVNGAATTLDGSARAAVNPGAGPRERFVDLARRGDYRAAYQVIEQTPQAVGSSAEDLMLAADAARLSNHPDEALGYLRRVTREHPRDSRAALSAFTQGRILLSQLGRPAEAASAFEQARRLAPSGALAEPALARQIEALAQAGNLERARTLAAEHAKRYPGAKDVVVPSDP